MIDSLTSPTSQFAHEASGPIQPTKSLESLPPGSKFGMAHLFQFASEINCSPPSVLPRRKAVTANFIKSWPLLRIEASPAWPE
eukprot:CAMPEP_0204187980 /NCGR_PEP_ID=MMETSP0361-20130328/57271_1 /ASSEMBLY_ACC=CAM_ASM_000343 /TAXON_ID=268821 /ORGANISM="Scrippsiella Hangoei, Strain SHTV-5" /LENGTH=82 /DNA_ID=CAMNT_0051148469 /DNA_START=49 /DNA_END=297 /DNA_ORIENTATION=+